MQVNRISNISYGSGLAKAAVISAMMAGSPAQAQEVKADTFELSPKTEYVSEMNNVYDDVFVCGKTDTIKDPKARGEEFNNWVMNLFDAVDEDDKVDSAKMKGSVNFYLNDAESFTKLAESIVASFNSNDDNKIDFDEFLMKSFQSIPLNSNENNLQRKLFYRHLDVAFTELDINESNSKKAKCKNTLDVNEVAANLMALSSTDYSGRKTKMYIDGQKLLDELNFMLYHGEANPDYKEAQEIIYENIK